MKGCLVTDEQLTTMGRITPKLRERVWGQTNIETGWEGHSDTKRGKETSKFSKLSPSRPMCRHHGDHYTLPPFWEDNLATSIKKLQNLSPVPFHPGTLFLRSCWRKQTYWGQRFTRHVCLCAPIIRKEQNMLNVGKLGLPKQFTEFENEC